MTPLFGVLPAYAAGSDENAAPAETPAEEESTAEVEAPAEEESAAPAETPATEESAAPADQPDADESASAANTPAPQGVDEEDAELSAKALTPAAGWTQCGECEWRIVSGKLTVRPINRTSGLLADWSDSGNAPWSAATFLAAVFESGVKAQTCYRMFSDCSSLRSIDLSHLDTSNVTDMESMFRYCFSLTSLNLSGFDTSNVTDMSYMFYYCSSLTSLDLSNFKTSNVTDMSYMFYYCESLTTLDLSDFNTSNVTDMDWMFHDCSSLTSLNLFGFNTSNVTSMEAMFFYCESLTTLDLSDFNTSKVTYMGSMFSGCSSLKEFKIGANYGAEIPDSALGGKWKSETLGAWVTCDDIRNNRQRIPDTYFIPVAEGWTICGECEWQIADGKLTVRPISGLGGLLADWDDYYESPWCKESFTSVVFESGVTAQTCAGMFYGCSNLTSVDLSGLDTSYVENMGSMFSCCPKLSKFIVGTGYKLCSLAGVPFGPVNEWWSAASGAWKTRTDIFNKRQGIADTYSIRSIEKDVVVKPIPSQKYDGYSKRPAVKLTYRGKTLLLNRDYAVSYSNNINVGRVGVTIKGIGAFSGTKKTSFLIVNNIRTTDGFTYKVIGKGKVQITACTKTRSTSAGFLGYVWICNREYRVVKIASRAFSKCKKLKTVWIGRSAAFTKAGFKGAFLGSAVTNVDVSTNAQRKNYKSWLTKSNCGRKITVTKW